MYHSLTRTFYILFVLAAFAPAYTAAAERSLYLGVRGDDVVAKQKQLITLGYLGAGYATGYFGPLTDSAVKKFQCERKVICAGSSEPGYGIIGPKTRLALTAAAASTDNPSRLTDRPLTAAARGAFEVSGWVPYWRAATGTSDTAKHFDQLTSVMPFAFSVKNDGTLADTAKLTEEPWASFIKEAQAAGVRVVPSIMWGDGEHIHEILSDMKKRIALEDEIAALAKARGYDGIDIDFEAKWFETIDYFSTFLKGLYWRMGNKWVYCTIESRMPLEDRYSDGATIPVDATDRANDYVEMNKYCDRVEIMAYDQGTVSTRLNAARAAPYAPVADPGWVENLVQLAAQTIDRNKLILGIPTYGYEYKVTPLSGNRFEYKRLWAFNPGYATDIALRLGILPSRNSAGEFGFSYDPKRLQDTPTGDETTLTQQHTPTSSVAQNASSGVSMTEPFNYVSWSDARAIADKVALAKRLGLRGVALFKFDGSADPGMWNALK